MTDTQNDDGARSGAPQYGQYHQPEYGAMANQYPAGYDPYVYGKPEAKPVDGAQAQAGQPVAQQMPPAMQQPVQHGPNLWGTPNGNPYGAPYGAPMQQSSAYPHTPQYVNGIDVNDPNQNPLYGRWDPLSIVSLICALLFPVPVLPAIMGGVSMRRTRLYHMKGFWLGFIAVFVNVFYTIMVVWLAINGMSMLDYYQEMLNMLNGGSGDGSGGGTTVSA